MEQKFLRGLPDGGEVELTVTFTSSAADELDAGQVAAIWAAFRRNVLAGLLDALAGAIPVGGGEFGRYTNSQIFKAGDMSVSYEVTVRSTINVDHVFCIVSQKLHDVHAIPWAVDQMLHPETESPESGVLIIGGMPGSNSGDSLLRTLMLIRLAGLWRDDMPLGWPRY